MNKAKSNPAQNALDRKNKKLARKNGSKGKVTRKTVYGTVVCHKHGKIPQGVQGITLPEVKVGAPRTKRERFLGCPACIRERKGIAA